MQIKGSSKRCHGADSDIPTRAKSIFLVCAVLVSGFMFSALSVAAPAGVFTKLATYRATGDLTGVAVAPMLANGDQYVYMDYMYVGNTIDLVRVNKRTGAVISFRNPVESETGSYGLIHGPDGNIYMGTLPHAHLYMLDAQTQTLKDIGMPVLGEHYIWDLTSVYSGEIYGVTYPSCHLFVYDPRSHTMADLGRMSQHNQYARFVVAGDDGYLYISVGSTRAGVVAYNLKTGQHRQILPADARGIGFYVLALEKDGSVHVSGLARAFRLHDAKAVPVPLNQPFTLAPKPGVTTQFINNLNYTGQPMSIFRLTMSPTGTLYAGTILPLHFFSLETATGKLDDLGQWGGGEPYSMLWFQDRVLLANYFAKSPLMSFNPAQPVTQPSGDHNVNPQYITFKAATDDWRPQAMVARGSDIYIGAVGGYGYLDGSLSIWNTETNAVTNFKGIIPDQSIVSLSLGTGSIMYGGTSVFGGEGTTPSQASAMVFLFDTVTHKVVSTIVPVPGAKTITDLIVGPRGNLFGFADDTLFIMNVGNKQVRISGREPYGAIIYNSIYMGPDNDIYGLSSKGIFKINPSTGQSELVAVAPEPITAGGSLRGNNIYFASNADVYQYVIGH